ncbi:hypothetical protein GIW26_11120 [Pseudomonas syringae]|uniref:hypothetical protein n=1 Tax=Pseudomonas syringae TaxID=317 RepID=UPI001F3506F1|nr:hypothetical protein [Pseudomonas syringae]MCF8984139.1 hypothetical protein [Pseudomonas syringae]MCF9001686.1 hypothetical protein [Pseudomonas syringae]
MSTDVEKSFTATLAYYNGKKSDGSSIFINIDFSFIAITYSQSPDEGVIESDLTSKPNGSISTPHIYLCANTKADSSVELYFRYDSGRSVYRIWVRNGLYRGRLLANSNNDYIYANINYGRPHLFWLYQQDENGKWQKITIDQFSSSKPFRIQQADTGKNIGVSSGNRPISGEPSSWWAYITTGSDDAAGFVLNDVKTNVDYASTDVWGAGKA